eukprot:TRINITY_DN17295_c0_g1_i1.p1 TRINITY_DN17295_c0_g1~~TRINITY_DN17295_c0_g1_i1.p1  ORF type:complete len:219 (-),score=62.53 TRINITY_DN17295_c0_g1_i1:53-709(-)
MMLRFFAQPLRPFLVSAAPRLSATASFSTQAEEAPQTPAAPTIPTKAQLGIAPGRYSRLYRRQDGKLEVILLTDVPKCGFQHELVQVSAGFARNYLVPKKLALYATPVNKAAYQDLINTTSSSKDLDDRRASDRLKSRISKLAVVIKRHVDDSFTPPINDVTPSNIVEKLMKQHKLSLSPESVQLDKPIQALGTFNIPVQVPDTTGEPATLVVQVIKR